MYRAYAGDLEIHQRLLHESYGILIRVAPDEIVCSDPSEIPKIYPVSNALPKTVWYDAWRPSLPGRRDMFTERSEKEHSAYRRTIGHIYSRSSVAKSEPKIDDTVTLFIERLDTFAASGAAFDFGLWLEMYAYDNIGAVFFSKQFGFLEKSIDHGGYIEAVHKSMPFLHVLAASPAWARPFLMGVAIAISKLLKAVIAVNGVTETAKREAREAQARTEVDMVTRIDMTSQMLGVMREKNDDKVFGMDGIISEIWVAVMAGADSTSIVLRSIFYFLMKNPNRLEKARAEIDAAFADGTLVSPVQQNQAIQLSYLGAVIRESFRLFSPFAVSHSRYTLPQGIVLAGTHIPGGWRVGVNPAVIHHHKEVFGADTDSFRPERWLDGSEEQIKLMQKYMMHFGAGTRTCTGQNIAMAEIYKVVPEIIHRFDFKMSHDGEWKMQNAGFNFQIGVTCYFARRHIPSDAAT